MRLTLEQAKTLLAKYVREPHLLTHAQAVSAAMGAMAEYFGEDKAHWQAVGWLHDVDFELYPEEHLWHTGEMLSSEGVEQADIRAIVSHGWGVCSDTEPLTPMEKSLFAVDELTGILHAASLMRPTGISDLTVTSAMKKFKDKRFAAKCDRELIRKGCDMLGMSLEDVTELCIRGMREYAAELGLMPKGK